MPHYGAMFVFYVHWQATYMQKSLPLLIDGQLQMASPPSVGVFRNFKQDISISHD